VSALHLAAYASFWKSPLFIEGSTVLVQFFVFYNEQWSVSQPEQRLERVLEDHDGQTVMSRHPSWGPVCVFQNFSTICSKIPTLFHMISARYEALSVPELAYK